MRRRVHTPTWVYFIPPLVVTAICALGGIVGYLFGT